MITYNIEIAMETLNKILEPANIVTFKGGFKLIGGKWFSIFEEKILETEGDLLKDQFKVNNARYYPNSKKAACFFSIYANCKRCDDLAYSIKLLKKPDELDESAIFTVEKSNDHDLERHMNIVGKHKHNTPRRKSEKKLDLTKEIHPEIGGLDKTYNETQEYNIEDILPFNPRGIDMISDILHAAITAKNCKQGKTLSGYIHDLVIYDKFSMTLMMEEQLEALHCLSENDRILHFGATEGLVEAKANGLDYGQILTYGLVAQNIKRLGHGDLLLSETSTNSHTTESITKMLISTQAAYLRRYPNDQKICYMLVLDLSWASIHASCSANHESFIEYNKRIWRLANGDSSAILKDKFLLASCCSRTIQRFTRALRIKKIFKQNQFNNEDRNFAIHCFSMMMNCSNIQSISNIFRLLCICFTREYYDEEVITARDTLISLIKNKSPLTDDAILDDDSVSDNNLEISHFLKPKRPQVNKKKLKDESPFTQHFKNILNGTKNTVNRPFINQQANQLFNREYISFLIKYFMPYCGIWAGFCFVNLYDYTENKPFTRISNKVIEKFWGYRKMNLENRVQTPINYSNKTLEKTRDQALLFKQAMKNQAHSSSSEIDSETDSDDELDKSNHKDGGKRKRKLKNIISNYSKMICREVGGLSESSDSN
jgi:hypothetical protein